MNDLTAIGGTTREVKASLSEVLSNMARLKNVPLSPQEVAEAIDVLSAYADAAWIASEFAGYDGLAAQNRAINEQLDVIAIARVMGIIMSIEGKNNANDPVV
jgi:ABC-type metal ion transport system substrate-binding protein